MTKGHWPTLMSSSSNCRFSLLLLFYNYGDATLFSAVVCIIPFTQPFCLEKNKKYYIHIWIWCFSFHSCLHTNSLIKITTEAATETHRWSNILCYKSSVSLFVRMYGAQVCLHGSAWVTDHGGGSSPPYLWSVALSGQLSVCVISSATLPSPPVCLPVLPPISFLPYHPIPLAFSLSLCILFPFMCFVSFYRFTFTYPPTSQPLSFLSPSPLLSLFPALPAEALEGNVTD